METFIHWARENSRVLLIGALLFISFIVFEARQQLFYAENFNNGVPVNATYWEILLGGLYRWSIWVACSIPLVLWAVKVKIYISSLRQLLLATALVFLVVLVNLAMVTLVNVWGLSGMQQLFLENFEFYFYHKAPIVLAATVFLLILVGLIEQNASLELKVDELGKLKVSNSTITNELNSQISDAERVLQIKVGQRIKIIPVKSITWIEADDYCVKIHDKKGDSATMRSSMKAFEDSLSDFHFVRVHRKALVNLAYMKEMDIQNSKVILEDGTTITIAKSRISGLKREIPMISSLQ